MKPKEEDRFEPNFGWFLEGHLCASPEQAEDYLKGQGFTALEASQYRQMLASLYYVGKPLYNGKPRVQSGT